MWFMKTPIAVFILILFFGCNCTNQLEIKEVRFDKILEYKNFDDDIYSLTCSTKIINTNTFYINRNLLNQDKFDLACLTELKFFTPILEFKKYLDENKVDKKLFYIEELENESINERSFIIQYGYSIEASLYEEQSLFYVKSRYSKITSITKVAEFFNYQGSGFELRTNRKNGLYKIEALSHSEASSLTSVKDIKIVNYSKFQIDDKGKVILVN